MIAIVGGGWYGCHIATQLSLLGFDFVLFERNSDIFREASGFNQNRLHLGFHYARNYRTRVQSLKGYEKFMEEYGSLTEQITENLYCIHSYKSLVDFKTYCDIMTSSNISFQIAETPSYLKNVAGTINTKERVIDVAKAKSYFQKTLGEQIVVSKECSISQSNDGKYLLNNVKYDLIIDTTWGQMNSANNNAYFELSLLLILSQKSSARHEAVTFVDGDLWSLYPTYKTKEFTLSSVKYTPILTSANIEKIITKRKSLTEEELGRQKELILQDVLNDYPNLMESFEFIDYQISIKTKLSDFSADRSCYVNFDTNLISVQSGKIDTIFHAWDLIKDYMINGL